MLVGVAAIACGGGDGDTGGGIVVERGDSGVQGSGDDRPSEALRAPTPAPARTGTVGDSGSEVIREAGTEAPEPGPTGVVDTTPEGIDIPIGDDYDPELNMYMYISGGFHRAELTIQALAAAVENGDRSQVPVIIEGLRIMQPTTAQLSTIALTQLTGEDFGPGLGAWNAWMEWYGRNSADYPPPEGYLSWKTNLLGQIDPAFADFLDPWALTGRINPTEIVWGGVRKDGIPDLQNPPLLTPEEAEATYILPEDRVFGVSINGEHRAYPLRVINAHEMANDVLGGEPIALAY